MRKKTLVVFIKKQEVIIRPYEKEDLKGLIQVYKSAFAEPPWNESWSDEDIIKDLEFAISQRDPIILVAQNKDGLAGMTWGYKLPIEKFPFLERKVPTNSSYMDEIAVAGNKRFKGVGTLLGRAYIDIAAQQNQGIVLRTDDRNEASMTLFRKLGLKGIPDITNPKGNIYDPQYQNRIYLMKDLKKEASSK